MTARDITIYGDNIELTAVVMCAASASASDVTLHIRRDSRSREEICISRSELLGLVEMIDQMNADRPEVMV